MVLGKVNESTNILYTFTEQQIARLIERKIEQTKRQNFYNLSYNWYDASTRNHIKLKMQRATSGKQAAFDPNI